MKRRQIKVEKLDSIKATAINPHKTPQYNPAHKVKS